MIAIIGGTGLNELSAFNLESVQHLTTAFGNDEVLVSRGQVHNHPVCFLPRHGSRHTVPPHRINYRANIQALHDLGVGQIIAVNAVGGIHSRMGPGCLAIPEQIIDYTWGRAQTFFEDNLESVNHIDFTEPYDSSLRRVLMNSAQALEQLNVWEGGVYGCTQGPRLETRAEISRMQRDGCDMVGMTGMPEAALARELGLAYASIALSVNWAPGISKETITMEGIREVLREGIGSIHRLLDKAIEIQAQTSGGAPVFGPIN